MSSTWLDEDCSISFIHSKRGKIDKGITDYLESCLAPKNISCVYECIKAMQHTNLSTS
jgi:hypothetical protein